MAFNLFDFTNLTAKPTTAPNKIGNQKFNIYTPNSPASMPGSFWDTSVPNSNYSSISAPQLPRFWVNWVSILQQFNPQNWTNFSNETAQNLQTNAGQLQEPINNPTPTQSYTAPIDNQPEQQPINNNWWYDESKIQSFIQRGKDLWKSEDEIKSAYTQAAQDWIFNQAPQEQPKDYSKLEIPSISTIPLDTSKEWVTTFWWLAGNLAKVIANIPPDIWNTAAWAANITWWLVTHPIDTIKNVVWGTAQWLWQFAQDIWQGKWLQDINQFVWQHPFQTALSAEWLIKTPELAKNITENVANIPENIKTNLQNKYTNQELDAWKNPTEINKPWFNKPTQIYEKATNQWHDIATTLLDNKIRLADNIEEWAYNTADTADKIRSDAWKMSSELLRPSLEIADKTTPLTPVSDIMDKVTNGVINDRSLTLEDKTKIMSKLIQTEKELTAAYPKWMNLTEQLNEKILRDKNAKYNPLWDISSNLEATKNKLIADSLRSSLETNTPTDIPIKEFNAELRKQYQAADYLDSLNWKKVPITTAAKIRKLTWKVIWARVWATLWWGLLGWVAGYHIGWMVETLLESMPNPVKQKFLDNLQVTNPKAFEAVKDYINTNQ